MACGESENIFFSDSIFCISLNSAFDGSVLKLVELILADRKFKNGNIRVLKHWAVEYASVVAEIFSRL